MSGVAVALEVFWWVLVVTSIISAGAELRLIRAALEQIAKNGRK